MTPWIYYLITLALMAAGLWINILTLPGLWLMVLAVGGYAWLTGGAYVGWPGVLSLTALALAAEAVEFIAGGAGASKAGGSKRAFVGAIVGGIVGAIFLSIPLPVIGTIIGICVGTFVGAVAVEFMVKGEAGQAVRVGYGATVGRLIGLVTKIGFGVVMFVVGAIVCWPTGAAPPQLPPPPGAPATQPATAPVV